MPTIRTSTRRIAAGVLLVAALLLSAGCAGEDQRPDDPAVPVDEIAAGIEQQLAERDDVAAADVRYRDDFSNPSTVTATITMAPGADPAVLYEEGERLIWESELDPLTSFAIHVVDPADPPAGISRIVSFLQDAEREPLEDKYGPRPR